MPGVRQAITASAAPVVAVSPIVGGEAIKGPTAKMFRAFGVEPSPAAVAARYRDFLDAMIVDAQDADAVTDVESLGLAAPLAQSVMTTDADKTALAEAVLTAAAALGA